MEYGIADSRVCRCDSPMLRQMYIVNKAVFSFRLFKSRFVLKCVLTQLTVFAFIAIRNDLNHMFRRRVKNSRGETSILSFV